MSCKIQELIAFVFVNWKSIYKPRFELDFQQHPSSYLVINRRTKDFSFLIAPKFSAPKWIIALWPIRVLMDIPWGHNCLTQVINRNETWLAVESNIGLIVYSFERIATLSSWWWFRWFCSWKIRSWRFRFGFLLCTIYKI